MILKDVIYIDPFPVLLRRLRERSGKTQTGLSFDAGYDQSYVCRLENGQRIPSRETVVRLADVLEPHITPAERAEMFAGAGFWPDRWEYPDMSSMRRKATGEA